LQIGLPAVGPGPKVPSFVSLFSLQTPCINKPHPIKTVSKNTIVEKETVSKNTIVEKETVSKNTIVEKETVSLQITILKAFCVWASSVGPGTFSTTFE
jgi:hypothetical protein